MGYVEVRLAQDAWAKSHRPVDKLFKPGNATLVGSNEIADLVFRVSYSSVRQIASSVGDADDQCKTKFDERKNKEVPVVSELRSEAGSIESVALWDAGKRDAPTAEAAIDYLKERSLAAYYRVELFEWEHSQQERSENPLVADLWERLRRLSKKVGVVVTHEHEATHPAMGVALLSGEPTFIVRSESDFSGSQNLLIRQANFSVQAHELLLQLLTTHPLVKAVSLPAVVERPKDGSFVVSRSSGKQALGVDTSSVQDLLKRKRPSATPAERYPRVCVVDGGIGEEFDPWVVYRANVVSDGDANHGTSIASLLVAGKALNANLQGFLESDGCELVDLAMLPRRRASVGSTYPGGAATFLDLLDQTLGDAKRDAQFRVVNMSLNIEKQVPSGAVSESARRLDEMARKHDVIFVVSAGNANGPNMREEWPASTTAALQTLLVNSDRLQEPADTLLNISVAALNPPGLDKVIAKAPARYSRRGAGLRTVKPDLCHFGGAVRDGAESTGLLVRDANQDFRHVTGTSFSAPLIAKTLAKLDLELGGRAPREVLLALLYHSARLHEPLDAKDLRAAAKQLVGFGLPGTAEQTLLENSSSFTFVFYDKLKMGENFIHDFEWPASLTNPDGSCSGEIKATLVSSPPIDYKFGAEAARMNVDLYIRQHNGKKTKKNELSFEKRVDAVHSHGASKSKARESSLLSHALKWSAVKVYEGLHDSVGVSSSWRFGVEYLERDKTKANMPEDGVPVAVVVTVRDPKGIAPVYDEMRAALTRTGISLKDIRTAIRTQAKT